MPESVNVIFVPEGVVESKSNFHVFATLATLEQCCQVKGNEEEVNHEEHREHEEKKEILDKILREFRVLRGEKFLIVQH